MEKFAETGRGFAAGGVSYGLETKDLAFEQVATVAEDGRIEGYASLFGVPDQGGDVVEAGAFAKSLERLRAAGREATFFRGGTGRMLKWAEGQDLVTSAAVSPALRD